MIILAYSVLQYFSAFAGAYLGSKLLKKNNACICSVDSNGNDYFTCYWIRNWIDINYSYLKLSIGSSFAARRAGMIPEIVPTKTHIATPPIIQCHGM